MIAILLGRRDFKKLIDYQLLYQRKGKVELLARGVKIKTRLI